MAIDMQRGMLRIHSTVQPPRRSSDTWNLLIWDCLKTGIHSATESFIPVSMASAILCLWRRHIALSGLEGEVPVHMMPVGK